VLGSLGQSEPKAWEREPQAKHAPVSLRRCSSASETTKPLGQERHSRGSRGGERDSLSL
jgi:hypothetical protein